MTKRLLFSIRYALLCTLLTFLLITVFGKHYQFDAQFVIPCVATIPGTFIAGWLFYKGKKKLWHLRIGLLGITFMFLLSWLGFFFLRIGTPNATFKVSLLKALLDSWLILISGALIMVPGFILLTYVAKSKDKDDGSSNKEERLLQKLPNPWEAPPQ